jgi:hypothetical protein
MIGVLIGLACGIKINAVLIVPPIAMIIVVWFVYQRVSSDQPGEVVAPFALSYA